MVANDAADDESMQSINLSEPSEDNNNPASQARDIVMSSRHNQM